MPPKKTRSKKSVKEEVDDLPSFSTFRERRVDPDALFAGELQSAAMEFGDLLHENLEWIFQSKEDLKKICEDFGGSKAVPKTPKREMVFSKIKDTINMFDNLALTQVPQQQRIPAPLVFDNAVEEDDAAYPDEVFEEEEERIPIQREIKTDDSPAVPPKTPLNGRVIKEEVVSDREYEENEEARPRRGRSRKETRTPAVVSQGNSSRATREVRDVEMRDHSAERPLLPQSRVHTPSRIRMGVKSPARNARSPARENTAARVQAIKKGATRMGGNESHSSSASSPSKTIKNTSKTHENDQAKRAELMRKLEEKGKTADQNREEAIRERAERARREREEREMKVRAKKEEEEKERLKKRMEMKDKERQVMEMKKRQAQSPVRGAEKERQGTKTPTRMRPRSPEGRQMKRVMNSPLTPRAPVKQHRVHSAKKSVANWNESEEDEMEREAKRIEKERKRRIEEENERIKKIKEEEERVARLKEEERRRAEERERREREKKEKERREKEKEEREREEKEKRMREEEEKKMKTPVLKNKHLANASMNDSQNSYEMTPDKIFVAATDTNYGVDDLDSGDETDDENNPRKKVPKWASHPQLARTLAIIRHTPPFDPDVFFGPIIEPDLNLIFKPSTKYPKRTSSAMWNSPLSNPTKGKSRFLNH